MKRNESFANIEQNVTVDFGKTTSVDLTQILPGTYSVITAPVKGKVEICEGILKYTSYTWLMEKDGVGFIDEVHNDTVKIAVCGGDKSAAITLHISINKLEDLFYDEKGNWIVDVDLMFTKKHLEFVKSDLKNNPKGDRAKIFDFMLCRVDEMLDATPLAYEGRPYTVAVEYDTDLRYVADTTVNFLMAYLLTEGLPGYEAKSEVYLQKTIQWTRAALSYHYWGATHYHKGYGWRNADLPAGHFLFSTAMVCHWLKDELKDVTCTHVMGADGTAETVVTKENMPILEALRERMWFVCDEMFEQTLNYDVYVMNHSHVRMGGLIAATIALRSDARTDQQRQNLVKYTGMVMYKDGLGMNSLMPDGTSQEGVPYWEYGAEWLIKAGVAIRQVFGIDLFATTHVLEHSGDYVLHNLLPRDHWESGSVLNVGDSPTGHFCGPSNILRFIAAEYQKANTQWLAEVVENSDIDRNYSQWMNVMHADMELKPEKPGMDKMLHWFRDMDHIIARNNWSGNEDMLSFKCGIPFGKNLMRLKKEGLYHGRPDAGHAHPDANHITLYANGEFLLRDDGYCNKGALNHNTLLVNGKGQLGEFANGEHVDFLHEWEFFDNNAMPYVKLAESNADDGYDYIVGNATEAYDAALGLSLFERNILWLKREKALLVVDNIKAQEDTQLELRWFTGSKNVSAGDRVYTVESERNILNFYPMTHKAAFEEVDTLVLFGGTTEKTFRQTCRGTSWQNAVAFSWNDAGREVAVVTYEKGENADEHRFGVNGKIYTIDVAANKVTVTANGQEA